MLRLAAGVLAGLFVVTLGWTSAPSSAAAASADPKVVLIVGATHGTTATYRSYMSEVAATAARYTRNLVKVYSPNATWTKVRAAMQDASIVVYMGHGNGFPSPYSTTPNPLTQNGMGLNATAGAGDSNTKYYGERYIANEVDLAPNAVVILSHLCYASGNSEPGRTEPSLAVAKARMDNFAAGFLRAGARAVIAEGHSDPAWYVAQLFTTHRTVEQIWRSGPRPHGNVFTFSSSRTSGYTVFSDPDQKSGSTYKGFYRSLVAKPSLTSDQVTGARYARTDAHPGWFVVPGAAEVVNGAGIGLFPDASFAPGSGTTLPTGTRLRLLAAAGKAPDGSAAYEVATLDGSLTGFASAAGLIPRDSASPRIWEVDAGSGALSPNGDARSDTVTITARGSEAVAWRVDIDDSGGERVARLTASGDELSVTWDALDEGRPLPDGPYKATVTAVDPWGNAPATASVDLVVDTVDPQLDRVEAQGATPAVFSPNGDGTGDTVRLTFTSTEAGTVAATVKDASGTTVSTFTGPMSGGSGSTSWDGRTDAGGYAPDGTYSISLRPVDRAGNRGTALGTTVVAYGALGFVATSVTAFHARDRDRYAKSTRLSFRLRAPATVTWQLLDAGGGPVIIRYDARALAAGSYAWTWDGRLPGGAWAPSGAYRSRVVATDGTTTATQSARFVVGAFRVYLSDATPARGQLIAAKILSTERLPSNPRLTFTQPGRDPVTVTTTRTSTYGYRASFRLSTKGSAGELIIAVAGTDVGGGRNRSRLAFTME